MIYNHDIQTHRHRDSNGITHCSISITNITNVPVPLSGESGCSNVLVLVLVPVVVLCNFLISPSSLEVSPRSAAWGFISTDCSGFTGTLLGPLLRLLPLSLTPRPRSRSGQSSAASWLNRSKRCRCRCRCSCIYVFMCLCVCVQRVWVSMIVINSGVYVYMYTLMNYQC